jgi:SAM-dependent methyltransferase
MSDVEYTGSDNLDIMRLAKNYNSFLMSLISKYAPRSGTLIDFGAGSGTYASMIPTEQRSLICVEPDAHLRKRLEDKRLETRKDITELPDKSADFVYTFNVLEHIEDDLESFHQIYRIMKKGSLCLVYVPAMPFLYSSMDEKVCHFRRYTRKEMAQKSQEAGFEIISNKYTDSLGVPATLAYKLFGSKDGDISLKGLVAYDRFAFPVSLLLDKFTHLFAGKNVCAVLRKP